jgi:hypothetical protein
MEVCEIPEETRGSSSSRPSIQKKSSSFRGSSNKKSNSRSKGRGGQGSFDPSRSGGERDAFVHSTFFSGESPFLLFLTLSNLIFFLIGFCSDLIFFISECRFRHR